MVIFRQYEVVMKGFVLLAVMVYLQILSLLSMQAMAFLSADAKQSLFYLQRMGLQGRAYQVLAQIQNEDSVRCLIEAVSVKKIRKKSLAWWKSVGCRNNSGENEYFFVREKPFMADCSAIKGQNNQLKAATYYRDTLLYVSALSDYQSMLLQATFAVAGDGPPSCSGELQIIQPGLQAIREL